MVSLLVAVIFGSVFHNQPYDTEATVWGRVGLIYLSTTFIGIVNMVSHSYFWACSIERDSWGGIRVMTLVLVVVVVFPPLLLQMSVMPVMSKERAAFYREQACTMYNVWSYAFSYALAELPYILITTGIFVNVFYRFVGLFDDLEAFVWYWAFFGLYISCLVRTIATTS